jgi:heme exporter protein B
LESTLKQTLKMLSAEFSLDIKRPAALAAAALQVFALGLLCYLSNPFIQDKTWNSLFWLSVIFSTLQAVSKGFVGISKARWIYLNQLASPAAIILAKIGYNWAIMIGLCLVNLLVFVFFMQFPVLHILPYMGFVVLVSGGMATVFTMISAIASKTTHPGFLLPVLSLPVILPLLLIGVQGSVKCMMPLLAETVYVDLLLLLALNLLLFILTAVLFNPLWRE